MRNLTLHPLWHTVMPVYEHAVGAVTIILSTLAFYLMLKKTPKTGKSFAKYLMLLQASLILVDLNYGFLFCPINLFPAPGGLCNGIICTWFGFSGHVGNSLQFLTLTLMGIAIIYCYHYKYLSIEQAVGGHGPETEHLIFRVILFVLFITPCIFEVGRYRRMTGGPSYVQENFPSLYYLYEDQKYRAFAYDHTISPKFEYVFMSATLFIICLSASMIGFFVFTSFSRLSKQTSLSEKTRRLQHFTMRLLIVQTLPPVAIQTTPVLIYTCCVITESLTPDINNALLCIQLTHAFFHTSILILTTPSYREPLMCWRRKKTSVASLYSLR